MAAAYNGLVTYTFLTRVEGLHAAAGLERIFTEVRTLFGIDGGSLEALLKHSIQQSNAMAQFSDSLDVQPPHRFIDFSQIGYEGLP